MALPSTLATLRSASGKSACAHSLAHSLLTDSLAAVKQRDEDRRASHAQASPSGSDSTSDSAHVTGSKTPPQHGGKASRIPKSTSTTNSTPESSRQAPQDCLSAAPHGQTGHSRQSFSSQFTQGPSQTGAHSARSDEERLQQVLAVAAKASAVNAATDTAAGTANGIADDAATDAGPLAAKLIGSLLPG